MRKKIITSGSTFIDIDAFACLFAYKELLDLKKEEAEIVVTAACNSSVTQKYKDLNVNKTDASVEDVDFVVIDVSDPDHFDKIVKLDNVSHIFDHHPGFESYWSEKIGEHAVIEPIGAAATLIFREYEKENLLEKISPSSAELLAVAILSNTLNFQAKITKEEDKIAYEELKTFFDYSSTFEEEYFSEVQESIEKNILDSLKNDSKYINPELFIVQLEVWDSKHIIDNFQEEIDQFLRSANSEVSFLNLIELDKKRNVIICNDDRTLDYLEKYFSEFDIDREKKIAITPHVMLRKEIITRISKHTTIYNR
ncbi:hypothetical protein KKG22_02385 [Patescibacteria group bacterium]|nr:hypothetical protein [Patescibacteria group bacterium]MBU1721800.1 hypothetical protein [Patescibacteria group bacterium]MBU1900848.1 hypothetical protein [Patescibacteria group bacterium]